MGNNQNQLLKAMSEAEAYDGPSLLICYAPCINHGINMGRAQMEQKKAVEAGYWQLYRFSPRTGSRGQEPVHAGQQRSLRATIRSSSWERPAISLLRRCSPRMQRHCSPSPKRTPRSVLRATRREPSKKQNETGPRDFRGPVGLLKRRSRLFNLSRCGCASPVRCALIRQR